MDFLRVYSSIVLFRLRRYISIFIFKFFNPFLCLMNIWQLNSFLAFMCVTQLNSASTYNFDDIKTELNPRLNFVIVVVCFQLLYLHSLSMIHHDGDVQCIEYDVWKVINEIYGEQWNINIFAAFEIITTLFGKKKISKWWKHSSL
jgi:hypothetical protein